MHFDAITLACVASSLNQTIIGGRVQQLVQVDEHGFGLEIYAKKERHQLLVSASPTAPRIHIVSQKQRRGVEVETPLLLLLRKYVRGARVDAVTQPDVTERVLHIRFDHSEHGETQLIVELIGRSSNLLLLGPDEKILDCLHRVRAKNEQDRELYPHRNYMPHPSQDKLSPLDSSNPAYVEQIRALLSTDERLWKTILANFAGVSPTLAREAAWQASAHTLTQPDQNVAANKIEPTAILAALHTIWQRTETNQWQPSLLYKSGAISGFAAYPLHFGDMPEAELLVGDLCEADPPAALTIHSALERYYARSAGDGKNSELTTASGATDPYAAQRGTVAALLRKSRKQVARRLAAVAKDVPKPGEAEAVRTKAEWILALSHQIEAGQTTLEVPAEYLGSDSSEHDSDKNGALIIELDPTKAPVEYAQGLFKRAGKLERAAEILPERKAKLTSDLDFLDQLTSDLQMAENQPEIASVQVELADAGLLGHQQGKHRVRKKTKQPSAKASKPRRYISPDGLAILVGRNARQNDMVTFTHAKPDDLWLHVRGVPGSHVVVRSGGQPVSEETLFMAAQLAAYYSSRRGERSATVSVTQRRNVTRVPKGRPGQVYMRNEETLTVAAELPADVMPSE